MEGDSATNNGSVISSIKVMLSQLKFFSTTEIDVCWSHGINRMYYTIVLIERFTKAVDSSDWLQGVLNMQNGNSATITSSALFWSKVWKSGTAHIPFFYEFV